MTALLALLLLPAPLGPCEVCGDPDLRHSSGLIAAVALVPRMREAELCFNEEAQELQRTYAPAGVTHCCAFHASDNARWYSQSLGTLPPAELVREFNRRLCAGMGVEYRPCK